MRSSANSGSFGFHRLCFWSRDKLTKRLKTRSIRSCIFKVFEDALVGNVILVVPSCSSCSTNYSYYLSRRERLPSTETHLSSACRVGLRAIAHIVPSSYRLLSTTAHAIYINNLHGDKSRRCRKNLFPRSIGCGNQKMFFLYYIH